MSTLVSILIIIAAILLIIVVLVQNSKGGGLAANFVSGNQSFGVRQTADFLEKATWTLIAAIFIFCILSTALIPQANVTASRSALQERLQNTPDPNARPEFPTGNTQSGEGQTQQNTTPDSTNK